MTDENFDEFTTEDMIETFKDDEEFYGLGCILEEMNEFLKEKHILIPNENYPKFLLALKLAREIFPEAKIEIETKIAPFGTLGVMIYDEFNGVEADKMQRFTQLVGMSNEINWGWFAKEQSVRFKFWFKCLNVG